MDPNQVPPQVGVNSGSTGASATGKSIFANPQNRFKDTNPNGDIIIPPSGGSGSNGSKKPLNKKLIVGIIAVVVVIAAVVAVVIATSGKKSGGSGGSGATVISDDDVTADVSAEVAEKFNKYANFIISGEASPERIPSEDEVDEPVIISKILDRDTGFMDEAKTYFDDFYNAFGDAEDVGVTLFDTVEAYKKLFDFLYDYSNTEILSNKDILDMRTKDGLSNAEAKIEEHYSSLASLESPDAKEYVKTRIAHDKAVLNNKEDAASLEMKASDIMMSVYDKAIADCYDIDYWLFETNEDEQVEDEPTTTEEESE